MLLSLIIPYFNSEKKSKRLLKKLATIEERDVEFILINDGSTDSTYNLLQQFKASLPESEITLIDQDNRGPGGARNSGLKIAKGKYVWFVDSDDNIVLDAIDVVREHQNSNYDFIDFNFLSNDKVINTMKLESGEYIVTDDFRLNLLKKFGRLCTKTYRRSFLLDNNILYPEYYIFEDNPLGFIYPLLVTKFLKTDIVGYIHHQEFESITRSKPSPIMLDRMHTAVYGFEECLTLTKNVAEIEILQKLFIHKYLIVTTMKYFSKKPNKDWLLTWRIMKQYRDTAKRLGITASPFESMRASPYNNPKARAYFAAQWAASHMILNDQMKYFDNIHKKAWE